MKVSHSADSGVIQLSLVQQQWHNIGLPFSYVLKHLFSMTYSSPLLSSLLFIMYLFIVDLCPFLVFSTTQGGACMIPFINIHHMCVIMAFDSEVHMMSADAGES
jgi:hypothetical protein